MKKNENNEPINGNGDELAQVFKNNDDGKNNLNTRFWEGVSDLYYIKRGENAHRANILAENVRGNNRFTTRRAEGIKVDHELSSMEARVFGEIFKAEDPVVFSDLEEELVSDDENDELRQKAMELWLEMLRENYKEARANLSEYEKKTILAKLILRKTGDRRTERTDRYRKIIREAETEIEMLSKKNPECYYTVKGDMVRACINRVKNGGMGHTESVDKIEEQLIRRISDGAPTLIHGHTGGGKTRLAVTAAMDAQIESAAYAEAIKDTNAFLDDFGYNSSGKTAEEVLVESYLRYRKTFEKAVAKGDPEAMERFKVYMISASVDLAVDDLFSSNTLKLSTAFNGKTPAEHREKFIKDFQQWKKEHPDANAEECEKARSELFDLYKEEIQSFGTEVGTVEKEVLKAMQEGRPVIIDEANTMPQDVMIALNNILSKKPGEYCDINGVGRVQIQPGFAIIMTANFSSNNVRYHGTKELNPATKDRFEGENGIIYYDYPPMSTEGDLEHQINPKKNELFQLAIAHLADNPGSLRLPEMRESLQKIFSLCQFARKVQNVFSGRTTGRISIDSGREVSCELNETTLSMRGLFGILNSWNKGAEKDLDKALWDGFIANISDSEDQLLILSIAKMYNFFREKDGYNIKFECDENDCVTMNGVSYGAPVTFNDIHQGEYFYDSPDLETIPFEDVVKLFFGPPPARKDFPNISVSKMLNAANDEMSRKDLEAYKKRLDELNNTIAALGALGKKCGCITQA